MTAGSKAQACVSGYASAPGAYPSALGDANGGPRPFALIASSRILPLAAAGRNP